MSLNLNGSLQKYESDSNDAFLVIKLWQVTLRHNIHKPVSSWIFSIVNFSAVLQICFENYTMQTGHLSKNGFLFCCPLCCCSIIQHMLYNIWFNLVLCGFLLLISCYRVQSKYYFSQSVYLNHVFTVQMNGWNVQFARLLNERFLGEVIKGSTGHSLEVLNDAPNDPAITLNEFFMLIKISSWKFFITMSEFH